MIKNYFILYFRAKVTFVFRNFSDPYGKTFRSGRKKISLVTEKQLNKIDS